MAKNEFQIMDAAADLLGTDAETVNPEYSRAISELTCSLLGISMEHKEGVLAILQSMAH